ncbi:hypothetical protein POVWA2_026740 [Plasmodium ovale wallikeri]|uniref:Uncharacterized protein n=1 Tax=Plasmodium ovale wallikeri TaxID=864142 RepID=A0A1A8YUH6_PLAOA|nr:hypothetical protein POVWA1_026770 [Plasmodium ovale wallikeri]SBT35787.1 hypothetical protein POVWA2_026740 [Plasmodium ovale wallikeri]
MRAPVHVRALVRRQTNGCMHPNIWACYVLTRIPISVPTPVPTSVFTFCVAPFCIESGATTQEGKGHD